MYLRIDVSEAGPAEGIRSFVRWCLVRTLASRQAHVGIVHVRLRDGRDGDAGEVTCEITAHRARRRPIVVCAAGCDVRSAVLAAAARLSSALARSPGPVGGGRGAEELAGHAGLATPHPKAGRRGTSWKSRSPSTGSGGVASLDEDP